MQTGVYPVYNTEFAIGLRGLASTEVDMATIADMVTFSMSIDGNVEEWTPMTTKGWARKLMTGKSFSISMQGKRNIGDPGNDYVHSMAFKDGIDCSTKFRVGFPDGSKLEFNCVISITNDGGGDSTNVAPLEFEVACDGIPNYTPATTTTVFALTSSVPVNDASGISGSDSIVLTFNDTVDNYTGIALVGDGAIVENDVSFDADRKVMTITPKEVLNPGNYTVVLSGVTSVYGSTLAQSTIKFTVA